MPGSGGCVGVDSVRVSMGCWAVTYHVPPIVRQIYPSGTPVRQMPLADCKTAAWAGRRKVCVTRERGSS